MTASQTAASVQPQASCAVDESARAAAITAYDIDGFDGDLGLNAITDFAAALCDAPSSVISLIEETTQRFLAQTGFAGGVLPRQTSICGQVMTQDGMVLMPDAALDPVFASNPNVTAEGGIRFYAGLPLVTPEGIPLGTLCVFDSVPRDGLTALQRQGLQLLADTVMARLTERRIMRAAQAEQARTRDSEERFRVLADAMPQMVWSTQPDGFHDYYNARWYEFTGTPAGTTDGEGWNGMFHADDQDRAWNVWRHSLETGEPYEIEYRLRHNSGEYRWTLGRALPMRGDDGRIVRWFGTCTDIHEHKLAADEREIVSQELSHRIKNIFSVIAGLIGFSARAHPQFADTAKGLRERVLALGRAHDFVRPHSNASRPSSSPDSLTGLLNQLFAPYQAADGAKVTIAGTDAAIDDRSATPFALLFHELATNAAKYGALSREGGTIAVTIADHADTLGIVWKESGGPAITAAPHSLGFGSQLLELSAVRQLGGTVRRDWDADGLRVTIGIPRTALSR